jgi:hypothetical protein
VSSEQVPFMINNEIEILLLIISPSSTISSSSVTDSSSSSTASSLSPSISSPSLLPIEVNPINKRLCNKRSTILHDHNYNLSNNYKIAKKKILKSRLKQHRVQYLSNWEKQPEVQYKTCF